MKKWILVIIFWTLGILGIIFLFFVWWWTTLHTWDHQHDQPSKHLTKDYKKLSYTKQTHSDHTTISEKDKEDITLSLVLPENLSLSGFATFKAMLTIQDHITLKIIRIKDIDAYHHLIQQGAILKKAHIFLMPYERKATLSQHIKLQEITFQENIFPYFSPLCYPILSKDSTILPFWLDPLIVLSNKIDTLGTLSLQDMINRFQLAGTHPLIIASWSNFSDTWILKGIFTWHQYTQFKKLRKLALDYYHTNNLEKLWTALIKKEPHCNNNKQICLLSYNLWEMMFSFLSEWNLLSEKQKEEIIIKKFPFYWKKYPVRMWGFIIPDNQLNTQIQYRKAIQRFLERFLSSFEREHSTMLPAVTNERYYTMLNNLPYTKDYKAILSIKKYWEVIGSSWYLWKK